MVLEKLGDALRETLRKIAGASHISPELIKELVRDIQRALLQSDGDVSNGPESIIFLFATPLRATPPPKHKFFMLVCS